MIVRDISLKPFNTFGLECRADLFITVRSEVEASTLIKSGNELTSPVFILGRGSNLLFVSDFHGTIIHPLIERIKIEKETSDYAIVSAGAGVNWDSLVDWTVSQKYGGIENLSLIPGTVGATPIQNIGAYGVEVRDFIEKVRAIFLADGTVREFSNAECQFGYRDSIFKHELKRKYLITRVYYRLSKNPVLNTSYGSLHEEVEKLGAPSIKTVRKAVINIRKSKLPDHELIGNAGSFFRNPAVSKSMAEKLKRNYPDIPIYNDPSGGKKVAAGRLIEQCGWKGRRIGNAGVHEKQALVLVNYGNATGEEIFDLSERIKRSVMKKFDIILEREVEVIGIKTHHRDTEGTEKSTENLNP